MLTDAANSNTSVLATLNIGVNAAGALIPAGDDSFNDVGRARSSYMLDDAKAEATRLIAADGTNCRNTVVVLVVGGGQGNTVVGANPATKASQFLSISSRRVPIYVIAIAPKAAEVAQLTAIATNSGGQYFEITKAMIDHDAGRHAGAGAGARREHRHLARVHGLRRLQQGAQRRRCRTDRRPNSRSRARLSGTVNLKGMTDITGAALPDSDTDIHHPVSGADDSAALERAADDRVCAAEFRRQAEGRCASTSRSSTSRNRPDSSSRRTARKLWVASAPAAASRNIFTVTAERHDDRVDDGKRRDACAVHECVRRPRRRASSRMCARSRSGPSSARRPAFMDPPSIDPPPDADYPAFIDDNRDRRTLIWIGGNDGMMHAIDARTGIEVFAFIPFNLLAKLKALPDGNAIGTPDYFVDSSAKLADVRIGTAVATCAGSASTCWRTYLFFGEGPGGTFYQALDVTLDDMGLDGGSVDRHDGASAGVSSPTAQG